MSKVKELNGLSVFLHISGCVAFLSFAIFATADRNGPGRGMYDSRYMDEIMEYIFTIVFFYLNYFILIPKLYFERRYVSFILLALLGFVVVAALPEVLSHSMRPAMHIPPPDGVFPRDFGPPSEFRHRPEHKIPFTNVSWRELGPLDQNFMKYSAIFILAITLRITQQLKRIKQEKADSEIMFLKAQINPHFLFNTLNSIYTLAIEAGANSTAKSIIQLSAIMRYATSEASAATVALTKEINYIDNYVTLQRLRLNERVKLEYVVTGDAGNHVIAPFLLIPFVENAFKYGVSTEQDTNISIHVTVHDKILTLHVINNKVQVAENKDHGTSIGIANTKKRLALLYPGQHELTINDDGKIFEVIMIINL